MEPKDLLNMEMVRAIDFGSMNIQDRDSEVEGVIERWMAAYPTHFLPWNYELTMPDLCDRYTVQGWVTISRKRWDSELSQDLSVGLDLAISTQIMSCSC